MVGKISAGLLGGIMVAALCAMVVTVTFASGAPGVDGTPGIVGLVVGICTALIITITAKSGAKAWRRLLIVCALLCFSLPLSTLIFSSTIMAKRAAVTTAQSEAAQTGAAIGAVIGGGILAAISGFFGFFLGIILLVIGLLVGKDKQTVVIQQSSDNIVPRT